MSGLLEAWGFPLLPRPSLEVTSRLAARPLLRWPGEGCGGRCSLLAGGSGRDPSTLHSIPRRRCSSSFDSKFPSFCSETRDCDGGCGLSACLSWEQERPTVLRSTVSAGHPHPCFPPLSWPVKPGALCGGSRAHNRASTEDFGASAAGAPSLNIGKAPLAGPWLFFIVSSLVRDPIGRERDIY